MRILQVIDSLGLAGGAQKLLVFFAETLCKQDHNQTLLCLEEEVPSEVTTRLKQAGVRLVFLPGKNLFDPRRFFKLVRFLRQESFDIIHTHLSFSNVLGIFAARLAGKKVVATLHNEEFQKRRYIDLKFSLETLFLRHLAHEIIAVGFSVEKAHRFRLTGRKINIVTNAVDLPPVYTEEVLTATRVELAGDPSRPLVISIGRLIPRKGYKDLINAFKIVGAQFPQAKLVIVSEGVLFEALKTQITELGIDSQAEMLGLYPDVRRLLAASNLYVNSSLYEGLSIAMLEAMIAGLPVVATNVGDASRVVVEGTGCLVSPGAPEELAEAICSLLADPEKMRIYGENARQRALNEFSPGIWSEKILSIYQQAAASSPDSTYMQKTE